MKDIEMHSERRWSELVPPHTALTFAAIWDPEEGMVTFSGAHLLDSGLDKGHHAKGTNDSPHDVPDPDSQSQVLTIDVFAAAYTQGYSLRSAGLDSFAFARDALVDAETVMDSRSCLAFGGNPGGLRVPPGMHTAPDSPAAASSMALASMVNAPFRKSMVKELVERGKQAYHLRSRKPEGAGRAGDVCPYELKCVNNVRRAECADSDKTVTDEGFYEDHRLTHGTLGTAPVLVDVNLSSAFSVTTTSTSRYVEIDHPKPEESRSPGRSPLGAPSEHESTWTTLRDVERDICFNVPLETGRRLRKPRSPPLSQATARSPTLPASPTSPADPAEVLARRYYNHVPSPSRARASPLSSSTAYTSSGSSSRSGEGAYRGGLRRTKELLQRVVSCRKADEDDRWVCVEVQHKVKQRVCAVDL
ncbi:hypothetical protein PYCCODRAFT_1367344 [Trametes coccinea BRFM310]|uniref:Uncharacterized protein n=1 Tax=Trametes coccinea (strain BRFM310) TaxID=1353009 RepID=A0A1Y2IN43_TRAC3|nr:hypothetical protein PYCCODRAFT_1367344 [Trametes coccinea BRFM310]